MKDYILKAFPDGKAPGVKTLISEVVVFLCILLFAYAAFSKLMDFDSFRLQLARSPYISSFSFTLAWLIPAAEIISAVLMISGRTRKYGLYIFTLLMASFTVYIAIMLAFRQDVPCICGGIISGLTWLQHMIFNIIFFLLGLTCLVFFRK